MPPSLLHCVPSVGVVSVTGCYPVSLTNFSGFAVVALLRIGPGLGGPIGRTPLLYLKTNLADRQTDRQSGSISLNNTRIKTVPCRTLQLFTDYRL